jgi:excinuclease UvrABC nuclease subunit
VFYDVSGRPIYVGKATVIRDRVRNHHEKFWFKNPIVDHAAYIEIQDERLRTQVEQILIKFLKSNAVLNKHHVER